MGFNSAFKELKLLKTPGKGGLNNLNDPHPQCVNIIGISQKLMRTILCHANQQWLHYKKHRTVDVLTAVWLSPAINCNVQLTTIIPACSCIMQLTAATVLQGPPP